MIEKELLDRIELLESQVACLFKFVMALEMESIARASNEQDSNALIEEYDNSNVFEEKNA